MGTHIRIESSGGRSGGEQVLAAYDTDELPADEAGPVHRAVVAIAAVAPGGRAEGGAAAEEDADLPVYRIMIGDHAYELSGELPLELSGPLAVLLRRPV
jgi:hypothetical protein